jgi:hypothetical protein
MAYMFALLILVFASGALFYLFSNNFARETLDVLFPAVGAILLSAYLGFKSVVIDRPEPKKFGTNIAVLHDTAQGTVSGMYPNSVQFISRFAEFKGAELIGTLPLYNDFKTIPISEMLRDVQHSPSSASNRLIGDLLEYALLTWLNLPEQTVGYIPSRQITLITGGGGSGGMRPNLVSTPIVSIGEPNLLLQTRPMTLRLPNSSNVKRSRSPEGGLQITIETSHTHISFSFTGSAWQLVSPPIGPEAERIYENARIPRNPKGLGLHGFSVEVEARQFAFRRFSNQAKVEAEWLNTLERNLKKDFSWTKLRQMYAG